MREVVAYSLVAYITEERSSAFGIVDGRVSNLFSTANLMPLIKSKEYYSINPVSTPILKSLILQQFPDDCILGKSLLGKGQFNKVKVMLTKQMIEAGQILLQKYTNQPSSDTGINKRVPDREKRGLGLRSKNNAYIETKMATTPQELINKTGQSFMRNMTTNLRFDPSMLSKDQNKQESRFGRQLSSSFAQFGKLI